jgi:hypothetical protein
MFAPRRHWSVVVPLLAILTTTVPDSVAVAQQKVGVNSAVNPDANGTPPGAAVRRMVVGQDVVHDEHIATGPVGQAQLLFIDESALTVGPGSDMTIDNFVFDPNTGKGQLAMSATAGVMRFVGGQLSKQEDAVSMRTPSGTIGIRGGIFVMSLAKSGEMQVAFLFGKGLTVTGGCTSQSINAPGCVTQTITRPGYSVSVSARGAAPSSPAPMPSGALSGMLAQLTGRSGATGGATTIPTDTMVANSGIATIVSANVAASVQQATQNTPATTTTTPPTSNVTPSQATSLNTTAAQAAPQIAAAQLNPTPPGTPTSPPPVSGNFPVVEFFTSNAASVMVTGVVTAQLNNGVLSNISGGTGDFGSIPLPTGFASFGPQGTTSCSGCGPLTGYSFLSADGSFLYAAYTSPTDPAGQANFLFGGTPTVNMPTTGTGTYSGNAVGGVNNNGTTYLATGTFNESYNFGNNTGNFALNNFDGKSLSGSISGMRTYGGQITGTNLSGSVAGEFFGANAGTTGGVFNFSALSGPLYKAYGVFGGNHQ